MDVLLSAVASDLIGRLVSFLIGKYQESSATEDAVRLQRALLRARAVVEEANGRQIANRAMLLQLDQLRRELCRAAYTLDTFRWRAVDPRRRSHATASGSRPFNQPTPCTRSADGIAAVVESLGAALSDMREFVVLLGGCPRVNRQPYSAYLFMESCMFGRQMEEVQIISFLLQPAQDVAVLPIIGPHDVGKRTLVEHVCLEETVKRHYTMIHRLSSDDLDLPRRGHEHHPSLVDATARSLFVVDLADGDMDEESWRRFRSSMRHHASRESKVIIISRTERHGILGTVPPLRLRAPRREELWYFFKALAFGGADPEERPELVRIAMALFKGFRDLSPFTTVNNLAAWLRADMSARSWRRVLNVSAGATMLQPDAVHGERGRPEGKPEFHYLCRPVKDALSTPCVFYDRRKSTGRARGELPPVTMLELVTGGASIPAGETRFDVLVWQSRIPPYASYVVACDTERAQLELTGERRIHNKRKRDLIDDRQQDRRSTRSRPCF